MFLKHLERFSQAKQSADDALNLTKCRPLILAFDNVGLSYMDL